MLNLFLSEIDVPMDFNKIGDKKGKARVLIPFLIEVSLNMCKLKGIKGVRDQIASFFHEIPFKLVNLDKSLIIKARP